MGKQELMLGPGSLQRKVMQVCRYCGALFVTVGLQMGTMRNLTVKMATPVKMKLIRGAWLARDSSYSSKLVIMGRSFSLLYKLVILEQRAR